MSARRPCLALLATTALLAGLPASGSAVPGSLAPAKHRADGDAAQAGVAATDRAHGLAAPRRSQAGAGKRQRLRALRVRWRAATSALRLGPGALIATPGTPGGSAPAPGGSPGGGSQPGGSAPSPPPQVFHTLSVAAREFSLTLSRQLLTPGTQTIQLNNRGEDPHNLVVSPDDGSHQPLATYPEVASLESHTEQVELPAGRYKLWCSLAGHEARGMRATLRVE